MFFVLEELLYDDDQLKLPWKHETKETSNQLTDLSDHS